MSAAARPSFFIDEINRAPRMPALGITLFANAFKDHAVVLLAPPESRPAKFADFGANRRDESSLLGKAVDTGRSNDVGFRCQRTAVGVKKF